MKLFHSPIPMIVALCLPLAACSRNDQTAPPEEAANEPPSNRVEIPATVRNNLGITFAKVERRNVSNTIRVPGAFELQPLARHEYRLMLPGVVEFSVDQFDAVKAGDILYQFRSAEWLELQATIQLANAALEQARTKLEAVQTRVAALKDANFKRADLDAEVAILNANVAHAEAELRGATSRAARTLNLCDASGEAGLTPDDLVAPVEQNGKQLPFYQTIDRIVVRAKEPGIVESLAVTDGVFGEETTLVMTTVDPDKVRFRALGLQSDLPRFKDGQPVRIVQPQANGADINDSIEAVLKIGLEADPKRRTVTLFANPKEPKSWIRSGVSGFMEVASGSTSSVVLAIPRSAVVKDGITHVFFKRDSRAPDKAIRVEADLGVDDGRWIEVKSDIGPNDEVVLNGVYELKLATSGSGTTQKGGHFHADGTFHGKH